MFPSANPSEPKVSGMYDVDKLAELFTYLFGQTPRTADLDAFKSLLFDKSSLYPVTDRTGFDELINQKLFAGKLAGLTDAEKDCILSTQIIFQGYANKEKDGFKFQTIYHYPDSNGTNIRGNLRQKYYLTLTVKSFFFLGLFEGLFHPFPTPEADRVGTFDCYASFKENLATLSSCNALTIKVIAPPEYFELFFLNKSVRDCLALMKENFKSINMLMSKHLLFREHASLIPYLIPRNKMVINQDGLSMQKTRIAQLLAPYGGIIFQKSISWLVLFVKNKPDAPFPLSKWFQQVVYQCLESYSKDNDYSQLASPPSPSDRPLDNTTGSAISLHNPGAVALSQFLARLQSNTNTENLFARLAALTEVTETPISDPLEYSSYLLIAHYAFFEALASNLAAYENNPSSHPLLGPFALEPNCGQSVTDRFDFIRVITDPGIEEKIKREVGGMTGENPFILPCTLTRQGMGIRPYPMKDGFWGYRFSLSQEEVEAQAIAFNKKNVLSDYLRGSKSNDPANLWRKMIEYIQRLKSTFPYSPSLKPFPARDFEAFLMKLTELSERQTGLTRDCTTKANLNLLLQFLSAWVKENNPEALSQSTQSCWELFVNHYTRVGEPDYLSPNSVKILERTIASRLDNPEWMTLPVLELYLALIQKQLNAGNRRTLWRNTVTFRHNECLLRVNPAQINGIIIDPLNPGSIAAGQRAWSQFKLELGRELPFYYYNCANGLFTELSTSFIEAFCKTEYYKVARPPKPAVSSTQGRSSPTITVTPPSNSAPQVQLQPTMPPVQQTARTYNAIEPRDAADLLYSLGLRANALNLRKLQSSVTTNDISELLSKHPVKIKEFLLDISSPFLSWALETFGTASYGAQMSLYSGTTRLIILNASEFQIDNWVNNFFEILPASAYPLRGIKARLHIDFLKNGYDGLKKILSQFWPSEIEFYGLSETTGLVNKQIIHKLTKFSKTVDSCILSLASWNEIRIDRQQKVISIGLRNRTDQFKSQIQKAMGLFVKNCPGFSYQFHVGDNLCAFQQFIDLAETLDKVGSWAVLETLWLEAGQSPDSISCDGLAKFKNLQIKLSQFAINEQRIALFIDFMKRFVGAQCQVCIHFSFDSGLSNEVKGRLIQQMRTDLSNHRDAFKWLRIDGQQIEPDCALSASGSGFFSKRGRPDDLETQTLIPAAKEPRLSDSLSDSEPSPGRPASP